MLENSSRGSQEESSSSEDTHLSTLRRIREFCEATKSGHFDLNKDQVSKEEEKTRASMDPQVHNQQIIAPPLTLEARFMPQMNDAPSCIVYATTNANSYEIKSGIF
ncbi:hypothetical protein OWV82_001558 [Melia azedarach]|uniref:Uncharacterized protein n=1 Tax=Melia azedarach TaxID=155640 RepID=A0ACC1YZ69_MELAZ|nr:hypothetical protein OWV82_001558 [Melia azedarach]